jgi:GcrA cell cycle regulator
MDQVLLTVPPKWADEEIKQLTELVAEKASLDKIARVMNRTKNSIIGKIHRLQKKESLEKEKRVRNVKEKKVAEKPRKPLSDALQKIIYDLQHKHKRVRLNVVESPTAVTIHELKRHMCKFPLGDPKLSDFRYCGKIQAENKPYCLEHCGVAYTQPSSRRRH